MASRFYGLNRGQHKTDVVEGASTGSKALEVQVDLTKMTERSEVIIGLREIINFLLGDKNGPLT